MSDNKSYMNKLLYGERTTETDAVEEALITLWDEIDGYESMAEEAAKLYAEKCARLELLDTGADKLVPAFAEQANTIAALRARLERAEQERDAACHVLRVYGNENNWKSINGVMTLQTLSHPWGDAQAVLRHLDGVK